MGICSTFLFYRHTEIIIRLFKADCKADLSEGFPYRPLYPSSFCSSRAIVSSPQPTRAKYPLAPPYF